MKGDAQKEMVVVKRKRGQREGEIGDIQDSEGTEKVAGTDFVPHPSGVLGPLFPCASWQPDDAVVGRQE